MSKDKAGWRSINKKSAKAKKNIQHKITVSIHDNLKDQGQHKFKRTTLSSAAMLVAGACLLAPNHSFAAEASVDQTSEI